MLVSHVSWEKIGGEVLGGFFLGKTVVRML